jgi:transcriptional regulator with XRE-family HTH domain
MTALRRARHDRGFTQVELAQRVGFTQQAVSLVELGGSRGCPSLRRKLSDVLGVPEPELFP